jgi:hypothetical protein
MLRNTLFKPNRGRSGISKEGTHTNIFKGQYVEEQKQSIEQNNTQHSKFFYRPNCEKGRILRSSKHMTKYYKAELYKKRMNNTIKKFKIQDCMKTIAATPSPALTVTTAEKKDDHNCRSRSQLSVAIAILPGFPL